LQRLPKLESLTLDDTEVTVAGLSRLGPPLRLRHIDLIDSEELIPGLAALKELRHVTVSWSSFPITREDVAPLASVQGLESIRFDHIDTAEFGVYEPLATAKGVKGLVFSVAGPDPESLTAIATLPALEYLELSSASTEDVVRLAPLKKLRGISFTEPLTGEEATRYSIEHPGTVVRYSPPPDFDHWDYYLDGESVGPNSLPPLRWLSEAY
jgi:hypothetical protein